MTTYPVNPLPTIVAITPADPPQTNSATVHYTVTFSEPVVGVNPTSFYLSATGQVTGAAIAAVNVVEGSNNTQYTVSVSTGIGDGTISLNCSGTGITDVGGAPIAGGTLQQQQSYATGSGPSSVVAADVNGDGCPDIIVGNNGANTVSVLLSKGDSSFQTQVSYTVTSTPNSVSAADVNGDGKSDVIAVDENSGVVSVLLGNGDGTFQNQQTYAAGNLPSSVLVGDLNGDSKPDLVVTDFAASPGISLLIGNGDGTFQAPRTFATGANPYSGALAGC